MLGKRKNVQKSSQPSKKRKKFRSDISYAFHQIEYNDYFEIAGIRSISPSPFHINTNMLPIAISRMNGSIEIWILPTNNPLNIIHVASFPHKSSTTVQRMKWIRPTQIVTAGLHGSITLWDIPTKLPIRHQTSHGGAIWDMDVHRNSVIIGCELGNVRHFSIDDNGSFIIQKVYTPASNLNPDSDQYFHNRILTVKFHPNGDRFICGGFNGVHCYKIGSSQYLFRTSIETNPCSSLCWLPHSKSFAIGDSSGNVHICEDQFGTILNTIRSHDHNVLEMISIGKRMFSSGVDGKLNLFECGSKERWFLSSSRRPSYHDIFGLVNIRNFIFSGGIDTRLLVTPKHDFSNEKSVKNYTYNWYPSQELSRFCNDRRLLCTYNQNDTFHFLHVPQVLVRKSGENIVNLGRVPFVDSPKCVYRINVGKLTDWGVNDYDVSSNGEYFGYISNDSLGIFRLRYNDDPDDIHQDTLEEEEEQEQEQEEDKNKVIRDCVLLTQADLGVNLERRGCHIRIIGNWVFVVGISYNVLVFTNLESKKRIVFQVNNHRANDTFNPKEAEETASCMFYRSVTSITCNSKYVIITFGTRVVVYEIIDNDTIREHWKFVLPSSSNSSSTTTTSSSRKFRNNNFQITKENVIYSSGWLKNEGEFYLLMTGQKVAKFSIPNKRSLLSNFLVRFDSRKVLGVIRKVIMFSDEEILFSTTKSLYLAKYNDLIRQQEKDDDEENAIKEVESINFIDVNEKKLSYTFLSTFITSECEIILLKNNWDKQMFKLPPVSWRKRFGT